MRAERLVFYLLINLFVISTTASAFNGNMAGHAENRLAAFVPGESASISQMAAVTETAAEESLPQQLAGYETTPAAAPVDGSPPPHSFEVAPLVMRFEYEEPSFMSEKGLLFGVAGRYRFSRRAFMVEGGLEFAAGNLDYDGSTWSGTPVTTDTEDYLLELRTLFGGHIRQGKVVITPFVGLGLRYWNDTIQSSGGYEREISYLYSPIGVKFSGPLSPAWSWSLAGEYDFFWKGWVISHLSDADPGYNDPENSQDTGDGYGLKFSLELRNHVSANLAWYIQPFFRYWYVKRSDYAILTYYGTPFGYGFEPKNNTTAYGASVGFVF